MRQAATYDVLDRTVQASFGSESSIAHSSDTASRMVQAVASITGTIARAYDGLERLIQETTPQGTVSYTYDNAGRRTAMSLSGQAPVNYLYDNADRLTQIMQGLTNVAFTYDSAGRRTSLTLPNGVVMSYSYDAASELTGISYQLAGTLGNLMYVYDLAGRRTGVGGSFARTGLPDVVASATYNSNNQLTQWASRSLSYDANGNLTSDGLNTYTWNARNQLAAIRGNVTANFQYDPFGRRAAKTIGLATTGYVYDGVNPVQELAAGVSAANLLTGGVDQYFQRTDTAGQANFLTDALGSTVALLGAGGSTLAQYTYEPFGNATASGSASNPYQYTGRENDANGLYYYRARYYNPLVGRFLSEDPIGLQGGIDLYAYVDNSPLGYSDPTGTQGLSDGIVNYLRPLPPPPSPVRMPPPTSPPILFTDIASHAAEGGSTTFYPGGNAAPFRIDTRTTVDSTYLRTHQTAGNAYCSTDVYVFYRGRDTDEYGPNGAQINTGDPRYRWVHGGRDRPNRPLAPTFGCTRGRDQDVIDLGQAITEYQRNHRGMPITYCRR